MSAIHTSHSEPELDIPRSLVLLLATGAGLGVASLYYCQPMLNVMSTNLRTGEGAIGAVPTFTQLGYAFGILFLSPLGDRYDRRSIILAKASFLAVALALSGMATGLGLLLAASVAVGLSATLAQDIVPAAAILAPSSSRGKAVGTVMSGLLVGILLSRVASGFVAERWGWRVVFFTASATIVALIVLVRRYLPHFQPTTQLRYDALLGSMRHVWKRYRPLRQAVVTQTLLSIGFGAFWSSLAILLHNQFRLGSAAAGAFGLAGAAGSAAAPLAGRLADRRGPHLTARLGCGLAALSFASLAGAAWLSPSAQLVLLVLCAIGFDFGVQAALVAHQTIVYGVEPAARSRSNSVLFTGMFIGMAAGSTLGGLAVARWGWMGLTTVSTAAALCALLVSLRLAEVPRAGSCGRAKAPTGETKLCECNAARQC